MFARAWLQYQSEQAMYCLAESKPRPLCRRTLETKLSAALPWGKLQNAKLNSSADGWEVEVRWKIQDYGFTVRRELDTRRILRNRALRW